MKGGTDPVIVDKDSGVVLILKIWFSTRTAQWGQRSAESATPDIHKEPCPLIISGIKQINNVFHQILSSKCLNGVQSKFYNRFLYMISTDQTIRLCFTSQEQKKTSSRLSQM